MLFKILALLEMAVFYGFYFSKMLVQKRGGIRTDQMGRQTTGFVRWIEISLKIVTCLVPVGELCCIFLVKPALPWPGATIGLLGVLVFAVSVVTMRGSWRAGVPETEDTTLVTTGIYRISRNPAFLGFDLLYLGLLLMFFHWGLLLLSALGALLFHLQIVNAEEPFLQRVFGPEYLQYQKTVCRYLGRRKA